MKMQFFDFEVFPHWWLCVFGTLPDDVAAVTPEVKSTFAYVSSDTPNLYN